MLNKMIVLLKAETIREWKTVKAYPFELITGSVSFLIITVMILFGISKLGSELQMFGVIFFPMIMNLIGGMSSSIRSDVQIGTFDQVYNSSYSLFTVSLIRTLINGFFSIFISVIISVIVYLFFYRFSIGAGEVLPLFVVIILLSLSVSTILAGLTILFRKIDTLLNFINIFLLIILMLPYYHWSLATRSLFAAIVPYSGIMEYVQLSAEAKDASELFSCGILMLGNALLWAGIAFLCYHACLKRGRASGTLGMY